MCKKILVSACLCGIKCKYNGGDNYRQEYAELCNQGEIVPVCPEHLGGLPIPRVPSEIEPGFCGDDVLDGKAKVIDRNGRDVSQEFIKGAELTVSLAKSIGATKVILKQGSPSCGYGRIYDGTFTGKCKEGNGVTVAALLMAGIEVVGVE